MPQQLARDGYFSISKSSLPLPQGQHHVGTPASACRATFLRAMDRDLICESRSQHSSINSNSLQLHGDQTPGFTYRATFADATDRATIGSVQSPPERLLNVAPEQAMNIRHWIRRQSEGLASRASISGGRSPPCESGSLYLPKVRLDQATLNQNCSAVHPLTASLAGKPGGALMEAKMIAGAFTWHSKEIAMGAQPLAVSPRHAASHNHLLAKAVNMAWCNPAAETLSVPAPHAATPRISQDHAKLQQQDGHPCIDYGNGLLINRNHHYLQGMLDPHLSRHTLGLNAFSSNASTRFSCVLFRHTISGSMQRALEVYVQ